MTVIVSTGGGSYVAIARTVAKYMPSHLPGKPTMIVKSMPGAGHVNATNHMYNTAPKDGSMIASIGNSIPQHEVTDGKGVRFESAKFNWLGSTGISNLMAVVVGSAGVKTVNDARNPSDDSLPKLRAPPVCAATQRNDQGQPSQVALHPHPQCTKARGPTPRARNTTSSHHIIGLLAVTDDP